MEPVLSLVGNFVRFGFIEGLVSINLLLRKFGFGKEWMWLSV